jgi:hypothetical protein
MSFSLELQFKLQLSGERKGLEMPFNTKTQCHLETAVSSVRLKMYMIWAHFSTNRMSVSHHTPKVPPPKSAVVFVLREATVFLALLYKHTPMTYILHRFHDQTQCSIFLLQWLLSHIIRSRTSKHSVTSERSDVNSNDDH